MAVVKHDAIEDLYLFKKVFLDRQPQIAPAVVVMGKIARDSEHTPRLFFQARADQGGAGQGSLGGCSRLFDVRGHAVEKPEIVERVEDAGERLLDETGSLSMAAQEPFHGKAV